MFPRNMEGFQKQLLTPCICKSILKEKNTQIEHKNYEAKFQLSLKTKALQTIFWGYGDLWIGYTQKANWQIPSAKTNMGDDSYFNAGIMDVYLSKVPKLLKDDPKVQIITIHGEGLMIVGAE